MCVAAVAPAWHSTHSPAAPANRRCSLCALLASPVSRWQVTQSVCVVFQLYAVTAGVPVVMFVPLLWQALVPQAPKLPPLAATTASAAGYVKATPPARKFTVPLACVPAA